MSEISTYDDLPYVADDGLLPVKQNSSRYKVRFDQILSYVLSRVSFLGLVDTPKAYIAGKYIRVNSSGTGLEFVDGTGTGTGGGSSGPVTNSPVYVSDFSDPDNWVILSGNASYVNLSDGTSVLQTDDASDVIVRARLAAYQIANRNWRIIASIRRLGLDYQSQSGVFFRDYATIEGESQHSDDTPLSVVGYNNNINPGIEDGWVNIAGEFTVPSPPNNPYLAFVFKLSPGFAGSQIQIRYCIIEDVTIVDLASSYSQIAASSANAAGSSASAAASSASLALTSATQAGTLAQSITSMVNTASSDSAAAQAAAAAAAVSQSSASVSSNQAGIYASSALTSYTNAQAASTNASGFAAQAQSYMEQSSTASITATEAAATATLKANIVASATQQANDVAALLLNSDVLNNTSGWTDSLDGDPVTLSNTGFLSIVTGDAFFGTCGSITNGVQIYTKKVVTIYGGRKFQYTINVNVKSFGQGKNTSVFTLYLYCLDSNYNHLGSVAVASYPTTIVDTNKVITINPIVDATTLLATYPTATYVRAGIQSDATPTYANIDIGLFSVSDVTEREQASQYAQAAYTSSQQAAASVTAAEEQASLATTNAGYAQTSASQASEYANSALSAKNDAEGASATATQQAGIAVAATNNALTALQSISQSDFTTNGASFDLSTTTGVSYVDVPGVGHVLRTANALTIYPKKYITTQASHKYRIDIVAERNSPDVSDTAITLGVTTYSDLVGGSPQNQPVISITGYLNSGPLTSNQHLVTFSAEFDTPATNVFASHRPFVTITPTTGGPIDILTFAYYDITQAASAQASAAAALQSKTDAEALVTAATEQASIATQQAAQATTSASQALSYQNTALQAVTDAQGAAATATQQAGLIVTAGSDLSSLAASLLPADFTLDSHFWTNTLTGQNPPDTTTGFYMSDATYGRTYVFPSAGASIYPKGTISLIANRVYRMTARVRQNTNPTDASSTTVSIVPDVLLGDYTSGASNPTYTDTGLSTMLVTSGWVYVSIERTYTDLDTAVYMRPELRVASNSHGGSIQVQFFKIEDVTESTTAGNYATASQTSATQASASATAAAQQATLATQEASEAATQASDALSYSNLALQAKNDAESASATATQQSGISVTAAKQTTVGAASLLPSDFIQKGLFWIAQANGDPSSFSTNDLIANGSFIADTTYGEYYQNTTQGAELATLGVAKILPGRTYKITVNAKSVSSGQFLVRCVGLDGSYALTGENITIYDNTTTGSSYLPGAWQQYTNEFTSSQFSTSVYMRPDVKSYGTVAISSIKFEDVTESIAAQNYANAAQTSATQASASATQAGEQATIATQQATIAQTSATVAGNSANDAQTYSGNAQTYANSAAQSASDASGSANSASLSAGVSSTSSANAANSAASASQSAAALIPSSFTNGGEFFLCGSGGTYTAFDTRVNLITTDAGPTVQVASAAGSNYLVITTKKPLQVTTGARYRITAKVKNTTASVSSAPWLRFGEFNSADSEIATSTGVYASGGTNWETIVTEIDQSALVANTVAIRPEIVLNYPNNNNVGGEVALLKIEDITQAYAAQNSATAAANSASSASTSATAAGNSATSAQTSAVTASSAYNSAVTQVASLLPERFIDAVGTYFFKASTADSSSTGYAGAPQTRSMSASDASAYIVSESAYGYVWHPTVNGINLLTQGVIPAISNKIYEITMEWEVVSYGGSSATVSMYLMGLDSNYNYVSAGTPSTLTLSSTGITTLTTRFGSTAPSNGLAWATNAVWLRPCAQTTTLAGSSIYLRRITARDVTAVVSSENSANAASISASTAATQASNAGSYATAAQNSATNAATSATDATNQAGNAQTYSGQAQTYAQQASTSASNALGSSNSASLSAGVASTSATNAATAANQATAQASLLMPNRLDANGSYFYHPIGAGTAAAGFGGDPITKSLSSSDISNYVINESGYGYVWKYPSAASYLATQGVLQAVTGKVYEISSVWEVSVYGGSSVTITNIIVPLNGAYTDSTPYVTQSATATATGLITITTRISDSSSTGILAWPSGTVNLRPVFQFASGAGSTVYFRSSSIHDVTALVAAENQASLAAGSATAAAGSASTASTAATNASQSAQSALNSSTSAATQATNASNSANNAQTYSGNAQTYAQQASDSATNAAGSANTASLQAGVASQSNASVQLTAAAILPERIDGTINAFSKTTIGSSSVTIGNAPLASEFVNNSTYGSVWQRTIGANASLDVATVGTVSFVAGRLYQVDVEFQATSIAVGDSPTYSIQMRCLDGSYADLGAVSPSSSSVSNTSVIKNTVIFACNTVVSGTYNITNASSIYLRPFLRVTSNANAGTVYQYHRLKISDVTSQISAQNSASAAATSASNASTFAGQAGDSASAAQSSAVSASSSAAAASGSATNAGTSAANALQYAGNAQTYANNAATSATNAAGSASSASTSAGLSASASSAAVQAATVTLPNTFILDDTFFSNTLTGQYPGGVTKGSFITLPAPSLVLTPDPTAILTELTFSRPSVGSYVGKNGLIASATSGTPRYGWYYSGSVMYPGGLLSEPASTNLYATSTFTALSLNGSSSTISPNSSSAPDGTVTASTIVHKGAINFSVNYSATSGASVVQSFYFKNINLSGTITAYVGNSNSTGGRSVTFTVSSGTITTADSTAYIVPLPNNWYRICIPYTASAAITTGNLTLSASTTGQSYSLWGNQAESGQTFATSYIATSGSQITRAAETFKSTLGSEFTTSSQTALFRFRYNQAVGNIAGSYLWAWEDSSKNNLIGVSVSSSALNLVTIISGTTTTHTIQAVIPNTEYKVAFGFDSNAGIMRIGVNGVSTDWTTTIPSATMVYREFGIMNGWINPYMQGMTEVNGLMLASDMISITT